MWPLVVAWGVGQFAAAFARRAIDCRDAEHRKATNAVALAALQRAVDAHELRRQQAIAALRRARLASVDSRWQNLIDRIVEGG